MTTKMLVSMISGTLMLTGHCRSYRERAAIDSYSTGPSRPVNSQGETPMSGSGHQVRVAALLLTALLCPGSGAVFAQVPVAPAASTTPAYMSASGAMTFGFTRQGPDTVQPRDVASILPRGSEIAAAARPLIEKVWRASPLFRRQCARLMEASVVIAVSLDFPRHKVTSNAKTDVTRKDGLRAHIHLRGADSSITEYLAHEIEHVLEQLDEVDLTLAVAERVHGAKLVEQPGAFETSRAIAVGRAVAREVEGSRGGR
jgi:hypothetical protein